MKHKAAILSLIAVVLLLSGSRAIAQHSQHQHQQPTQASKTETTAKPTSAEEMVGRQAEMSQLVDRLRESVDALESEKEPSAMKQKLAEHRALLDQLQTKMKQRSEMIQQMSEHMKTCPMMGSGHKHE